MSRIGTVGYLNAKPLTRHIPREEYEVVEGHPSVISELLVSREIELGLVPVVTVLQNPELRVVGGMCIGAKGPVQSVFLVSETPIEEWTEVLLDDVSRTSMVLAQLLLRGPLASRIPAGLVCRTVPMMEGIQRARGTTATLVIGDVARKLDPRFVVRLDLAELWTEWTGLPFVFAVWAGHQDASRASVGMLRDAAAIGLPEREAVYDAADHDYLLNGIRYSFDEEALVGLRRFAALAFQNNFVESDVLQFYAPASAIRRKVPKDWGAVLDDIAAGHTVSESTLIAMASEVTAMELGMVAHERRLMSQRADDQPWYEFALPLRLTVDATTEWIHERVDALLQFGARRVVLWDTDTVSWATDSWVDLLSSLADKGAEVYSFSLSGIQHHAQRDGVDMDSLIRQLKDAGLKGLAEGAIVSLHEEIGPQVVALQNQIRLGLGAGLVVEYGFGESVTDRIHALGVLSKIDGLDWIRIVPAAPNRAGAVPMSATAQDHIQMVALSRTILSHITNQWAVWMLGARVIAQQALLSGCNGLGSVLLEEGSDRESWEKRKIEVEMDLDDTGLCTPSPTTSPSKSRMRMYPSPTRPV